MNTLRKPLLLFIILAAITVPSFADAVTAISTKGMFSLTSSTTTDSISNTLKQCRVIKEVRPEDDPTYLDIEDSLLGHRFVRYSLFQSIAFGGNPFSSTPYRITYYACPAEAFAKIQSEAQVQGLSTIPRLLISTLAWLVGFLNYVLTFVLSWAGYLLIVMIGQGKFITSDIVRQAWPFVQGVANLGFIFGLLYIALGTTFRWQPWTDSIYKLLPKLLISALLVNFSLVIGGLIIDASRLVMAAEIRLMGNGSLNYENFTAKLVEKSNQTAATFSALNNVEGNNMSAIALKLLQSSVFLGLLTIALVVIAVNLFIRYIALLVLLILSPLAYLAAALPKTTPYAMKWWGHFIKWNLYGPIVLFFLIIITRIQEVDVRLADAATDNKLFGVFFNQFAHFAIVIALFFVANSVGKTVAGMGSDAVMGYMKKNKRTTTIAAASLLSGGLLGGAAAAALTSRSARDFYKGAGGNIKAGLKDLPGVKQASEFLTPAKRDKNGKLLPGEKSLGSQLAGYTSGLNPKIRKEREDIRTAIGATGRLTPATVSNVAFVPSQLRKGSVVAALGPDETTRNANIQMIIEHGTQAQRMALAQNKEYIASLNSKQMGQLQQIIQTAVAERHVDQKDGTAMIERIMKTVDDLDK